MAVDWPTGAFEVTAAPYRSSIAIGPFGSRMKADNYVPRGVPVIRGTNLTGGRGFEGDWVFVSDDFADGLENCIVRTGDLVFPHRGAIGEVGIVPDGPEPRWMLSTSLMKVSCDRSRFEPLFYYYFFKCPQGRHELLKNASQVGTPGIARPLTSLKECVVPLPPLDEQRRIAAVLGALDDKIELNRKMNRTLEEMAQAIFKSWFIDFDGHDDLVDSEIGPVPRGWEVGTLGDLADLNPESWNKLTRPASISYVDLSNTKWGAIEAVTEFQAGDAPSRAQRVLRPRDTIVGTVRPGNGSYALVARSGLTGSTGFAVLRPKDPESAPMIYLAATRRENIDRLAHLADGGAYPAVRPEIVAATPTVVPPAAALAGFAANVDPLLQRVATNRAESRTLADLRDTLLPKLISGELRVPEAEALVEAAS